MANPAGAATVPAAGTADAVSQVSANMPFEVGVRFKPGNALFRKTWVVAPVSTLAADGLGPLYCARAGQDCHLKDGRGHRPEGAGDTRGLDGPAPGHAAEGRMAITWTEISVALGDGTVVNLRAPDHPFADPDDSNGDGSRSASASG